VAFQFQSRAAFFWIILTLVLASLLIAARLEQTRFGAWLLAIRENEDSARALGVDVFSIKVRAMILSAAITATAGCFYAQYFLFVDSTIAFGSWISVEALLAPIVGGSGTVFGPLAGAIVVRVLGEAAKLVAGDAPGIDLAIYGAVLVGVVAFAPRGIVGLATSLSTRLRSGGSKAMVRGGRHG
jgi:branched-chain amino acid transport system permease protein